MITFIGVPNCFSIFGSWFENLARRGSVSSFSSSIREYTLGFELLNTRHEGKTTLRR